MKRGGFISDKVVSIQVVRRALRSPRPGLAEPRHEYTPVITARASVKTRSGLSEFAQVEINGNKVTHTFSIRWTSIPFDTRDRIRDARGALYQILQVDNVDLGNKEIRIHAAATGSETQVAAQ